MQKLETFADDVKGKYQFGVVDTVGLGIHGTLRCESDETLVEAIANNRFIWLDLTIRYPAWICFGWLFNSYPQNLTQDWKRIRAHDVIRPIGNTISLYGAG